MLIYTNCSDTKTCALNLFSVNKFISLADVFTWSDQNFHCYVFTFFLAVKKILNTLWVSKSVAVLNKKQYEDLQFDFKSLQTLCKTRTTAFCRHLLLIFYTTKMYKKPKV